LVEIVRGRESDDRSLATAAAVGAKIGKTPILVGDSAGFVVNRVLIPYLREAIVMATEGVSIVAIDDAMKRWGMPMGPFELLDEIGLDVAVYVLKSLTRDGALPPPVEQAIGRGWLGKKSGRGFYIHTKRRRWTKPWFNAKRPAPNEEIARKLA